MKAFISSLGGAALVGGALASPTMDGVRSVLNYLIYG
jgi:hypothetical protein